MDEFEKTIRKQVEENCSDTCFYTLWPMKTYRLLHALSEAKEYMAFLGELGFKKSLYRIILDLGI